MSGCKSNSSNTLEEAAPVITETEEKTDSSGTELDVATGTFEESTRVYTTGNDDVGKVSVTLPEGWSVELDSIADGSTGEVILSNNASDTPDDPFLSINFYATGYDGDYTPQECFDPGQCSEVKIGDISYYTDFDYIEDKVVDFVPIRYVMNHEDDTFTFEIMKYLANEADIISIMSSLTFD
jgi:hypothetical protein